MVTHFDLPNEKPLISAAQRGNLNAFNRLVLHYQDTVYNLTYHIMGDEDMAADATQETFITAFHRLETYKGRNFRAWLLRVATNNCYDAFRTKKRHPLISLEGLVADNSNDDFAIADLTNTPEQLVEVDELNLAIQSCLKDLSIEQRIVLVLRDIEGYSYQEIATFEAVQIGTIKSRLSRARVSLRRSLQQYRDLLPVVYHAPDRNRKLVTSNHSQ
jgi:RNA polymerase sigma-70 factor, ECF subfamily